MRDTRPNPIWPVDWTSAGRLDISLENLPSEPRLAAHRMLDRLAALAHAADGGATDGADAFRETVRDLATASWPTRDPGPTGPAYRGGVPTLIDHTGLNALHVAAARLAGPDGSALVLRLTLAALTAEAEILGDGYLTDRAFLGGGGSGGAPRRAARGGAATAAKCVKLLDNLIEFEDYNFPLPVPDGPVSWTTGIESVEVIGPCDSTPTLVVHGHGFGAAAPPGVSVIAPRWNEAELTVEYRPVQVVGWTDTAVTVRLGADAVGGGLAFADVGWISAYNQAVKDRNRRVARKMHQAGCPGYGPSAHAQIWGEWSGKPPVTAANTYAAGPPHLSAELTPSGAREMWSDDQLHLGIGQAFTLGWKAVNADTVTLRATGEAGAILAAAGQAAPAAVGAEGHLPLPRPVSPPSPGSPWRRATRAAPSGRLSRR
ncbi:hypothetical protein E1264_16095 [Actinomadura sp. KC216]|uniref:hypothetical protein n=1 Tax=Actinomadura sp. KC216 TaxID=2530370 RepID=UPI00104CF0D4|nr:hypothetical protein [Actinomadura sp. KC216]TDB86984.1 hypothetical protein E1264_16095 [Actinomadura sp. KC216]